MARQQSGHQLLRYIASKRSRPGLENRDVKPAGREFCGKLQPDQPCPNDHHTLCRLGSAIDPARVLDGPQNQRPVAAGTGQRARPRTGCEQEFLVGERAAI